MGQRSDLGERTEWLGHGYKELEIPPARDGGFRIEPNALHIWPRGRYMCIALPNDERTFTVTLFMALHAEPGNDDPHFDSVATAADARALFERDFPDRSEEHTSELQSLMRHSYAVLCLTNKKKYS